MPLSGTHPDLFRYGAELHIRKQVISGIQVFRTTGNSKRSRGELSTRMWITALDGDAIVF
jgi:hypothetical protein